jgi:hypothetical protein
MSSVLRFDEWQDSNGVPVASGAGGVFTSPGNVIAVKNAIFTGTQSASVAGGGNVAVTDLSITHTLQNSANKLIVSAYIGQAGNSADLANIAMALADDGTLVGIGDAAGGRIRAAAGSLITASGAAFVAASLAFTFVYLPGNTSSHTYTLRAVNLADTTQTLFINRTEDDAGTRPRTSSALVIQEVAG